MKVDTRDSKQKPTINSLLEKKERSIQSESGKM